MLRVIEFHKLLNVKSCRLVLLSLFFGYHNRCRVLQFKALISSWYPKLSEFEFMCEFICTVFFFLSLSSTLFSAFFLFFFPFPPRLQHRMKSVLFRLHVVLCASRGKVGGGGEVQSRDPIRKLRHINAQEAWSLIVRYLQSPCQKKSLDK